MSSLVLSLSSQRQAQPHRPGGLGAPAQDAQQGGQHAHEGGAHEGGALFALCFFVASGGTAHRPVPAPPQMTFLPARSSCLRLRENTPKHVQKASCAMWWLSAHLRAPPLGHIYTRHTRNFNDTGPEHQQLAVLAKPLHQPAGGAAQGCGGLLRQLPRLQAHAPVARLAAGQRQGMRVCAPGLAAVYEFCVTAHVCHRALCACK